MGIIIDQLAKELNVKKSQVATTVKLIDEGNTIPFIARYRKEMTGGLDDVTLRNLDERLIYLRNLKERKEDVIKIIDEQGKLTEELKEKILKAEIIQQVEDLYRPYKQKRSTRATKAKEKGLEPLSKIIISQEITDGELSEVAKAYIDEEKGVETVEEAIQGALDIIAEMISDNPDYRKYIRNFVMRHGLIKSEVKDKEKDEKQVYQMYYDFQEKANKIANHRVLALNRGEKEEILKVNVVANDNALCNFLNNRVITNEASIFHELLKETVQDSYKRLIFPSIEREIRSILTESAEAEAISVFSKNTKSLLMIPPVEGVNVLAIDPSFRTGCKIAVLDKYGKLLDYTTIYPNAPQNKVKESKATLKELIKKYTIDIIPIGNGTASRETASLVAEIISELDTEVYYTIVSEDGASVYSASKIANDEFPEINVSIRGAISIGRRLQDPLAELVKIDPMSIGVGQYQHDLNKGKLEYSLTGVVEDCVNSVGVDLNTASPTLLQYISGLSSTVSTNILKYKEEKGQFSNRKELLKVSRLGPKTFEQCAGFLRIKSGDNILDNTGVHPESYDSAMKLLELLNYSEEDVAKGCLEDINDRIKDKGGISELSKALDLGLPTLKDIVRELKKPGRDPREEMPKPIFKSGVLSIEDLSQDMVLKGTVRNVVAFGCFVDIGIKQDGLVHISEMSDSYVENPMDIVKVGDIVDVKIIDIDVDRQRIALSMRKI
ncbi:MAG TPA: Tex family protein [Clostridia bacterium]|nr:Tex family protein [Clostridia bacterium]